MALSSFEDIGLIELGDYTLLQSGKVTVEIVICLSAVFVIGVLLHYKIHGSFIAGLIFSSIIYWWANNDWPSAVFSTSLPLGLMEINQDHITKKSVWILALNIIIIGMLSPFCLTLKLSLI